MTSEPDSRCRGDRRPNIKELYFHITLSKNMRAHLEHQEREDERRRRKEAEIRPKDSCFYQF